MKKIIILLSIAGVIIAAAAFTPKALVFLEKKRIAGAKSLMLLRAEEVSAAAGKAAGSGECRPADFSCILQKAGPEPENKYYDFSSSGVYMGPVIVSVITARRKNGSYGLVYTAGSFEARGLPAGDSGFGGFSCFEVSSNKRKEGEAAPCEKYGVPEKELSVVPALSSPPMLTIFSE